MQYGVTVHGEAGQRRRGKRTVMRVTRLLLPLLLVSLAAGCAAFTGKQDYADYRAIRLAPHEEARLLAMQRYVSRHPDGQWSDEVQAERSARELAVFEASKRDRAGLELYVAAFPDGEFIEQARSRLQAIELIEQRKQQEAARAEQLAQQRKQREQELRRTWVTRFLRYWTRTLLSLSNWGAPIAQVAQENADFSKAFGRPPRPRCTREECVKYYSSSYAVPVPGGTRLERSLQLILRLRLREGKLQRAELLMPGWGFSRWRELEEQRVVVDSDPQDRRETVSWAVARIKPLLQELMPGAKALQNYELAAIPRPAIEPSGELTDTSVEDPSAPQNQIQQDAPAQAGASDQRDGEAEPDVQAMLEPQGREPEADMVIAPVTVGRDGRAVAGGEPEPEPTAVPEEGHSGEVMVMDPVTVGEGGAAEGGASEGKPAAQVELEIVPPHVEAYASDSLRLVVFAAGSDASAPAYDGVVLERIAKRSGGKRRGKAKTKTRTGSDSR